MKISRSNLKLHLLKIVALLMLTVVASTFASAEDENLPTNWPWRGVNMAALLGKNDELVRFKQELNINMVRLHFLNFTFRNMDRANAIATSFHWLDQILDDCEKLGITAVINLDFFPFEKGANFKSNPEFWNNPKYQDEIVDVSHQFAMHFRDRGKELAAYDILSEPLVFVNGHARVPDRLDVLQTRVIETLRQVDPNRWIVLAPGPGGGPVGYTTYSPPNGSRFVWGVHMYLPHDFTHQGIHDWPLGGEYTGRIKLKWWDKEQLRNSLQPVLNFQKLHPGPVWVGEFSAVRWAKGGEHYLLDVTDIFKDNKWGWTYFSGLDWHGWNPDFDSEYSTDQDSAFHRVGLKSERWKTLKEIFKSN